MPQEESVLRLDRDEGLEGAVNQVPEEAAQGP